MEIRNLEQREIPQLAEYNDKIYPEKEIPACNYLNFWFSQHPDEYKKTMVLVNDSGRICGQNIFSSMSYFFQSEKIDTVWGFDLIVDEDLRPSGWGADLLIECKSAHPKAVSTGSGPTALPINLKLGHKFLGEIRKYIGIANPFHIISSAFRGYVGIADFPDCVSIGNTRFCKISKEELPELVEPFNADLFEPCREINYLKWRFFSELHHYAFYKACNESNYFVLRTIVIKHITILLLVDYRCDMHNQDGFSCILDAVLKVARSLRLGIVSTGSSLAVVDGVLESKHFRSIGRPRPFIGFLKCKDRKEDIEARKFGLITLADSDGETNFK